MAEGPAYPPDAAICRLLADGPLPTTAVAERLAMPIRTTRHRLRQLREASVVVTGADGLHRLAAPAEWDLADPAEPDHRVVAGLARPDLRAVAGSLSHAGGSGTDGQWPSGAVAVTAAVVGLVALAIIGRTLAAPETPTGYLAPVDPWWGMAW